MAGTRTRPRGNLGQHARLWASKSRFLQPPSSTASGGPVSESREVVLCLGPVDCGGRITHPPVARGLFSPLLTHGWRDVRTGVSR